MSNTLPTLNKETPTFDINKHVASIKDRVMSFAGKAGYNPFYYINQVLTPLAAKASAGDADSIDKLKAIDPNTVEPKV